LFKNNQYSERFSGKIWKLIYDTKLFNTLNKKEFNVFSVFYTINILNCNKNILSFFKNHVSDNLLLLFLVINNSKNTKKVAYFSKYLHRLFNIKLFLLLKQNNYKILNFFYSNAKFFFLQDLRKKNKNLIFYYKTNFYILKLVQRVKNYYFFKVNNYSVLN